MTTIILQRFANREYRLTNQSIFSGSRKKGDKYTEKQAERYASAVHNTYVLSKNIEEDAVAEISGDHIVIEQFGEVAARQALRALDIINEFQTTKNTKVKGGWGHLSKPTSFTKNARHRLLEAGAIVDKFCGLNAYEVTCTLPGSTRDSMRLLAENTGWIMNELTQIIRRSKCKYWFYVWEYQKRGALHLHMLVADPEASMENLAQRLQSRWWQLLMLISNKTGQDAFGRRTGGTWQGSPFRWQSHIAPIRKSVAAYFSKYVGKGSSPSLKNNTAKQVFCPSRWWGCSTEIKEQIKKHRQKYVLNISNTTSTKIWEHLQTWLNTTGLLKGYSYEFRLGISKGGTDLGGGKVQIGFYTDSAFARLQSWESTIWQEVLEIAKDCGDYEDPTQTWTDADFACRHPLDADMEARRHANADMLTQTCTATPSPHSQPISSSRKLSKSRGTQAKPTLELRARLIQFLAGGDGVYTAQSPTCYPPEHLPERPTMYIQGELFNVKNYYNRLTGWLPVQNDEDSTYY